MKAPIRYLNARRVHSVHGFALLALVAGSLACASPRREPTLPPPDARSDIARILSALENYSMRNRGSYPGDLTPLVTPDVNGARYLAEARIPRDPWSHEYQYAPPAHPGEAPRVWSLGADGRPGRDDIESWNPGR